MAMIMAQPEDVFFADHKTASSADMFMEMSCQLSCRILCFWELNMLLETAWQTQLPSDRLQSY